MTRRPLPALISLLALVVLTLVVWWRVVNRDTGSSASPTPKSTAHSSGSTCANSSGAPTVSATPDKSVTVAVQNSTERHGIAAAARQSLVAAGFNVPDPASNDTADNGKIPESARILYQAAGGPTANLLRYYFAGSTLAPVAAGDTSSPATVTVVLGTAYASVATPAAVQAAIAATSTAPTAPAHC